MPESTSQTVKLQVTEVSFECQLESGLVIKTDLGRGSLKP